MLELQFSLKYFCYTFVLKHDDWDLEEDSKALQLLQVLSYFKFL